MIVTRPLVTQVAGPVPHVPVCGGAGRWRAPVRDRLDGVLPQRSWAGLGSCASPGSCVAGGYYHGRQGLRGFAVIERDGRWGTAAEVPGLAALNTSGRQTAVSAVSCAPAGSCVIGGFYTDRSHHRQGFVTGENNGAWGTPIAMPGLAALNKGGAAEVLSLSCPAPGKCAAAGFYDDRSGHHHAFVTQAR